MSALMNVLFSIVYMEFVAEKFTNIGSGGKQSAPMSYYMFTIYLLLEDGNCILAFIRWIPKLDQASKNSAIASSLE